jgi:citrate lyase subunit beta/citryl-CoA lyase
MSGQSAAASGDGLWPIRTMLFVPSNRPDWVPKAADVGPDAVILDLEDSVAQNDKMRARGLIDREIATLRDRGVAAIVKTNPLLRGGLDDLHASVRPGLAAILLPKAGSADEIRRLHDALSYEEGRAGLVHGEIGIIALPETAEALKFGYEIAKASARVKGLLSGVGPIQGDIAWALGFRATIEGREQQYLQSKMILDSRAAGADFPIAGVFVSPMDDLVQLETLVRHAKTMGFTGVHVVHPSHVKTANKIMRPSPEEVEYFSGLIAAIEAGQRDGRGAVRYRGTMVDLAMLPTARSIVADAARYNRRS